MSINPKFERDEIQRNLSVPYKRQLAYSSILKEREKVRNVFFAARKEGVYSDDLKIAEATLSAVCEVLRGNSHVLSSRLDSLYSEVSDRFPVQTELIGD